MPLATTRIIPMHINKGKTLAQCLSDRMGYGENPEKTNGGEYITSYECDPQTADSEFLLSKKRYLTLTGRTQDNDVIAYQIRQSFKPGEITPEEANRIGYEFAMRFTKGEHAFIMPLFIAAFFVCSDCLFHALILWLFSGLVGKGPFYVFQSKRLW